ncbi:MAG: hypothetical protein AAFP81_00985 [Pseudomonadota bacterium]
MDRKGIRMKYLSIACISLLTALSSTAGIDQGDAEIIKDSYGKRPSDLIQMIGKPDFVILASDDHELAEDLKPSGMELFWKVEGCLPASVMVSDGRITGSNTAAFASPDLMCSPEMEEIYTPAEKYSCDQSDRRVYCQ